MVGNKRHDTYKIVHFSEIQRPFGDKANYF